MFDLNKLKQLFFAEIMKAVQEKPHGQRNYNITVDLNTDWIFGSTGFVNAGWDSNGNWQIFEICIGEAYFQFSDFIATLDERHSRELEKFCTE